jgi:hypothetical protein
VLARYRAEHCSSLARELSLSAFRSELNPVRARLALSATSTRRARGSRRIQRARLQSNF